MAKSGDIAGNEPANVNVTTGEVQQQQSRPAERFRSWVMQRAEDDGSGSWEVTAKQLDRMLMATSYEEIMDADEAGTHQGRDLVDFEFEVTADQNFRYATSSPSFEAPLGVYLQFTGIALMDFEPEQIKLGDEVLISTGAPLIIGKLRTLQANGFLPRKFVIKGTPTPNGVVLKLRTAPNRAVASSAS